MLVKRNTCYLINPYIHCRFPYACSRIYFRDRQPYPDCPHPLLLYGKRVVVSFCTPFLVVLLVHHLSSIYYVFSWPTSSPLFSTLFTFITIFSFFSLLPPPGYTLFHLLTILFSLMDVQPYKPRLLCRSLHFHRFYILLYCYVYS